jgi:LacI family transcriptional regulator
VEHEVSAPAAASPAVRQRGGNGHQAARVTVKDVARAAGVSHSTVSKALNESAEISAETRARVVAVAAGLGYRPNAIARSLKVRQTRTLGVITSDSDGFLGTAMTRGVAELASEHDFGVFVCDSYQRSDLEQRHLTMLLDKQVDGIILAGSTVDHRGAPAAPTGDTPVVYLYEYTTAMAAPCIVPDDQGGARLATSHLLGLGRRRVGLVNGPPSFEAAQLRLIGYRQALDEAGVPIDYGIVRVAPDWSQDAGYRLAREVIARADPPDALLCGSDELAAGVILGLADAGVRVPSDVSVVGFENRPFAAHLPVPLTTVAMPLHDMGVLAARRLLAALAGEPMRDEIVRMPCRLIFRDSCGG